jgi:RHS repeat-associated protein
MGYVLSVTWLLALFRQYASTQGRWLSPDPYHGSYDLTDPQSLNRYTYVMGRPLSAADSDGLFLNGLGDGGDDGGGGLGWLLGLFGLSGGGGGGHQRDHHRATTRGVKGDSLNCVIF